MERLTARSMTTMLIMLTSSRQPIIQRRLNRKRHRMRCPELVGRDTPRSHTSTARLGDEAERGLLEGEVVKGGGVVHGGAVWS